MSGELGSSVERAEAAASPRLLGTTPLERIDALSVATTKVPLGFACRSCGSSTYNHLTRIVRYLRTGEPCCPNLRHWLDDETPVAMSAAERYTRLSSEVERQTSSEASTGKDARDEQLNPIPNPKTGEQG